ncbi:Fic family protein [Ferruginibacter paludis]|uniref:Fic family protein n=1 Tax=Ferruginibacter paludis TaxID=1310417 RepID=UPI00338F6152
MYPTPIHKAAALIESLQINHPFIDRNKRTGYVMMRMLLIKTDWTLMHRKLRNIFS